MRAPTCLLSLMLAVIAPRVAVAEINMADSVEWMTADADLVVRGGGGEATPAAPRVDAHVEMPPLTIWEEPLGHLARAHAAIRRGDPAVAEHDLAALRDSCARAQARFHQYMDRVGAGADTTASALEGVVMASTMAISMLSGAAMVGASTVAVGALSGAGAMAATAVMGGARRGSEMRHGLRREMDLLGLIETAGQEGLSTMVSALLGGVASRRRRRDQPRDGAP